MNRVPDSIEIPKGYVFGATACGLKASKNLDLSVMVANEPCNTFGAFTQNLVRASSVDWNESRIGTSRAIVINSGNANACTGQQGIDDTEKMATTLAGLVDCRESEVCVMSTGIIGEHLPMEILTSGIESVATSLNASEKNVREFADGILTTDTFPKIVSQKIEVNGESFSILGVAKGAGMIGPKMATMLCLVVTDFPLPTNESTQNRFLQVIQRTFNSIGVDGHTSTSDQVILFAANSDSIDQSSADQFFAAFDSTCEDLAKLVPADGEGATHLITIEVEGTQSNEDLRVIAKTIADSPLVKTAIFGADPNWGRIVSAAGYSGIKFEPSQTSLWVNESLLFENGTPVEFDPVHVSESIKSAFDTHILLRLCGQETKLNSAKFWTSDLTYEYVKINAEYHT